MLGREGHSVQSKQGAGKRQRGTGWPGKKGWSLSTHLKGSRLEQAHEIRPNCLIALAITMTTGYNINHFAHCSLFDFSV